MRIRRGSLHRRMVAAPLAFLLAPALGLASVAALSAGGAGDSGDSRDDAGEAVPWWDRKENISCPCQEYFEQLL